MKTAVILQRNFLTGSIGQNSKNGMFCATDLVKIINKRRSELNKSEFNISQYLKSKSVIEFIEELQEQFPNLDIIVKKRGRNASTWVHPLLFIDIALSVDPKLKVSVYGWLQDELIKYRNDSGNSYKKMVGALMLRYNKDGFKDELVKLANYIKLKCNVSDWNTATEEQLKLRDKIHYNITLLCDVLKDTNQAVRLGVDNALNEYNKNKLK